MFALSKHRLQRGPLSACHIHFAGFRSRSAALLYSPSAKRCHPLHPGAIAGRLLASCLVQYSLVAVFSFFALPLGSAHSSVSVFDYPFPLRFVFYYLARFVFAVIAPGHLAVPSADLQFRFPASSLCLSSRFPVARVFPLAPSLARLPCLASLLSVAGHSAPCWKPPA